MQSQVNRKQNRLDRMSGRNVDEHTLLHSGCNLPDDGEPLIRNKGVGIVLD